MLGYVQIFKPELKVREYEIYMGYYCGICKYIGREYGQIPRMTLSYDAAFLALLLASVEDVPDAPGQEHCVVHHVRKKTVIRNAAIEYAGDVMLILAWYKMLDDAHDEGKAYAKAASKLLRRLQKKLRRKLPDLCDGIEMNLAVLNGLENAKCPSLDEVAESFSKIMEVIFREGAEILYENQSELHEIFAKIGYHMGKWIYLMDAVDDIEENLESGAYNPLLYRFEYSGESADEFRDRIRDSLEFNLYQYLAVLSEHTGTLDIKKNQGIIDNVIYFGMNRKTEEILNRDKAGSEQTPAYEHTNKKRRTK